MHCIECTTANPDTNHFCSECGAELGHTLSETLRKKGLRDRHMIEMEITESVAERLMKWAAWTRNTVGVIVALFALLLGTPIAVQQKLMRHGDIRTTMNTYGDVVTDEMSQAHSKVVRLALSRSN
jgi:integrase